MTAYMPPSKTDDWATPQDLFDELNAIHNFTQWICSSCVSCIFISFPPSKTDDWATPQDLFDELNAIHNFTLDVAASSTNHKTPMWFGLDHDDPRSRDGLARTWAANRVWCNPPYGRQIKDWVKKAHEESKHAEIVMLLPARTDTAWFHDYAIRHKVTFIRGRLKFGNSNVAAPFPSILVEMK